MPTDIVFQVLLDRLRYKLSFRDIAKFFMLRGLTLLMRPCAIRKNALLLIFAEQLRAKRKGKVGRAWFVDETYLRVKGIWCHLYRGTDEDGNLVDARLSEKQDMEAAKAFFAQAHEVVQQSPQRLATDGYTCYSRTI